MEIRHEQRVWQTVPRLQDPTPEHTTKGTDTCKFITKQTVPKKPTYLRIVSEYREQKEDPYRVRLTVGGNLIEVTGDISTKQGC
jgi:hypothetical protein